MKNYNFVMMAMFLLLCCGISLNVTGQPAAETTMRVKEANRNTKVEAIDLTTDGLQQMSVRDNSETVLLAEDFEQSSSGDFPAGWQAIGTPGGRNWTTNRITDFFGSAHSGSKYAGINYANSVAHNAWLYSPALVLTAGTPCQIKFWVVMNGFMAVREKLEVKIGNGAVADSMTVQLYQNETANITGWQQISAEFTPQVSGEYYIGFHAYSPRDGGYILIDDVEVTGVAGSDLQNITACSFTQLPVSQTLLPVTVKNSGSSDYTNVTVTAQLNETALDVEAPLDTLKGEATAQFAITPAIYAVAGANTFTSTVTADQSDEFPDNNTATFNFTGTANTMAVDSVSEHSVGMGGNAPISIGNIFTVTEAVTISQVMAGFVNSTALEYSLSLYPVTGGLTIGDTPLFTQPAVKNASGFSFVDVPETQLARGSYYLCINQLTSANIGVSSDRDLNKQLYGKTGTALSPVSGYGAIALRMITVNGDCTAQQPSSLTVDADHTSATFTWEGTTPQYFELAISDGYEEYKYRTVNNTITIQGMPDGTAFTWKVTARCDATNGSEPAEGAPFSTDAYPAITEFPFTEGFEDTGFPPYSWTRYILGAGTTQWEKGTLKHSGTSSARHANAVGDQEGWLVTPQIAVPADGHYILEFWTLNTYPVNNLYNGVLVSVEGKNPEHASFVEIKKLAGAEISSQSFQKITVSLLEYAGQNIYIAFRYAGNNADIWYIDDITVKNYADVTDAEVAAITSPVTNNNLTASEPVTILIKNNGGSELSGFELQLELDGEVAATETFTGVITGLQQAEYTFDATLDLSAEASYEVKVTITAAGDQTPENNTKTATVVNQICPAITQFPYNEGFEGETPAIPGCWFQNCVAGSNVWTVTKNNAGYPNAPHSGTYFATIKNTSVQIPDVTRLVLPPFNLSEIPFPSLKFWHTQEAWYGEQDILKVYGKASRNGEWVLLASYENSIKAWTEEEIILPNPSADYYIAFEATVKSGRGIALDDVAILNMDDFVDVETAAILSPVSGRNYTATEPVTVLIGNNGGLNLTGFDITLELNGETIATETCTGTISPEEQMEYTFDATLNLAAEASYEITVTAAIAGDNVPDNNSKTVTVTNQICEPVTSFPYMEDFEENAIPRCWLQHSTAGNVNWTVVSNNEGYPGAAHEGQYFAVFKNSSSDNPDVTKLISPQFNLSELYYPVLKFWHTQQSWTFDQDVLKVYCKSSWNSEWVLLASYESSIAGWKEDSVILPNPSADYYIAFEGTGKFGRGIALDDITLFDEGQIIDTGVESLISSTATGDVTVVIKNWGTVPVTSINVGYTLNSGTPVVEQFSGNLAAKEQIEYTFTEKISETGYYSLNVYAKTADDTNSDNDTLISNLVYQPQLTLYGYRSFDAELGSDPRAAVSFTTTSPQTVAVENSYTDGNNNISAGEYVDGNLYLYSVNTSAVAQNFIQLSVADYSAVSTHAISKVAYDMAYDYTTATMYAISGYDLFTVSLVTGQLTNIGNTGRILMTLACSTNGTLYIVDNNGMLCTVNKTTAAVTEVGSTGVTPKYTQSMTFDRASGRLLWAMCNSADEGILMEINPLTGNAYELGKIGGNAQIVALYSLSEAPPQFAVTYNSPENGTLTVTASGTAVASGTMVNSGTALTITATPSENYELDVLTVNGEVFTNGGTHTVTSAVNIGCSFKALVEHTITLLANPTDGGNVTGGGNYIHGSQATVTATPDANYTFVNWTEDGIEVENAEAEYTFTVTGNRTLVANFTKEVDGIAGNTLASVTVYGNKNSVYIVNKNNIPLKSIQIIDVLGRVVYSDKTSSSVTIPVNGAGGIYVVKLISDDNKVLSAKVHL